MNGSQNYYAEKPRVYCIEFHLYKIPEPQEIESGSADCLGTGRVCGQEKRKGLQTAFAGDIFITLSVVIVS